MTLFASPAAITSGGRPVLSVLGILARRKSAAVAWVQIWHTVIAAATKPRAERLASQLLDALLQHNQNYDTDQHRHTDSPDHKAHLSLRNRSDADMEGGR
jgi:hypothetical protein